METTYFCYIRCSTKQQSYDRQYKQLNDFLKKEKIKISPENIVEEKRSGKNQDRPLFKKLVADLLEKEAKGVHCCLILIELSRMGRSYLKTKETWNQLTSAGVDIVVTQMADVLDTRKKSTGAVGVLLADIVFSVLNYLTEQELNEKAERCNNGRAAALEKGEVKFGRKKLTFEDLPTEFIKTMKLETGETNKNKLLRLVNSRLQENNKKGITRITFYKYFKMYQEHAAKKSKTAETKYNALMDKWKKGANNTNAEKLFH